MGLWRREGLGSAPEEAQLQVLGLHQDGRQELRPGWYQGMRWARQRKEEVLKE